MGRHYAYVPLVDLCPHLYTRAGACDKRPATEADKSGAAFFDRAAASPAPATSQRKLRGGQEEAACVDQSG